MTYSIQIGNGNSVSYDDLSESQVSELRAERNAKLARTDVYMVSDLSLIHI